MRRRCPRGGLGMKRTHGMASPPVHPSYRRWANMIQRCTNPHHPRYKDYGGRGIKVCKRWRSFEAFYADVGEPPSPAHTLDRKKNNRGYMPSNVQWATYRAQASNSRRAVMVTHAGKTQCISDWCREIGLAYVTYKHRRKRGWSLREAATTPPNPAHQTKR